MMGNGQNATYLTEKYPGQECGLWTPCIFEFLCAFRPELPIYSCVESPSVNGPWYELRPEVIKTEGTIVREQGYEQLLDIVDLAFDTQLREDPSRFTDSGDITGIVPDMVVIHSNRQRMSIVENKPYYQSQFDGNQVPPDGAYIRFVEWLNRKGVPTRLIVIHSSSWKKYEKVLQLNRLLKGHYGSVMLEDIFQLMQESNYRYKGVLEKWSDFTNKSPDCA